MKVVGGRIAEATEDEMFDFYLTRDWDMVMPFREWLRRCKEQGTKVVDEKKDNQ